MSEPCPIPEGIWDCRPRNRSAPPEAGPGAEAWSSLLLQSGAAGPARAGEAVSWAVSGLRQDDRLEPGQGAAMRRDVGVGLGVFVGPVDVQDSGVAVVDADPQFSGQLAVHQLLRIDIAVPQDVGEAAGGAEFGDAQGLEIHAVRRIAAAAEAVVLDQDGLGIGVEV